MTDVAPALIRSLVDRIENIEQEIADRNEDKREIYKEAKLAKLDVPTLKAAVAYRRKDPDEVAERNALLETYLAALDKSETKEHARAPAPARPPKRDPKPEPEKLVEALTIPEPPKPSRPTIVSSVDPGLPDIPDFLDRRKSKAVA